MVEEASIEERGMAAVVEGPKIAALSCGKPVYLVVLLHGPGSDGGALIDQALNWAPALPKADFVAAEAPFLMPEGGRQWFESTDLSPAGLSEALETTAPLFDAFLDDMLEKCRLPDNHLALVGFSHGATLALHVGLKRQKPLAAIVSFSGLFHGGETFAGEIGSRPPVLMIHGDADPVAPISGMMAMREFLKAEGVAVKTMRRPGLGHEMDDDGIIAAGDFLTAQLVSRSAGSNSTPSS
jgi:phospholipase/carboxylesterase